LVGAAGEHLHGPSSSPLHLKFGSLIFFLFTMPLPPSSSNAGQVFLDAPSSSNK